MDMDNLFKEKNQHTLGMLIVAIGKGIKKHVNQEVYTKKTKHKVYICSHNNWSCTDKNIFADSY